MDTDILKKGPYTKSRSLIDRINYFIANFLEDQYFESKKNV